MPRCDRRLATMIARDEDVSGCLDAIAAAIAAFHRASITSDEIASVATPDALARLLHPTTTGQIVRVLAAPVLVVPVLPNPAGRPERTSSPSAIAHPFGQVVVPVGHHQPIVDACIATANNLAVGGGGSIMLLTCDGC